jgi:hypothetical protein
MFLDRTGLTLRGPSGVDVGREIEHGLEVAASEEYLLDVLKHGENTGEAEYEATDSDVECWIHVDVSYQRYAFGVGDSVFEFSSNPIKSEIASTVTQLQSQLWTLVQGSKW